MKIEIKDGIAKIYTPYSAEFVRKLKKNVGGASWDFGGKYWTVPESAADSVRNIMREVYGYSDIDENETVTLRLTFYEDVSSERSDVIMYGKVLAHAYGRDSGAKVGDGVVCEKGEVTSGGSSNHWKSIVKEGAVLLLCDVNKNIYEKEKNNSEYDVDTKLVEKSIDKFQLKQEKIRLLKRIEEIDALLADNN